MEEEIKEEKVQEEQVTKPEKAELEGDNHLLEVIESRFVYFHVQVF